MRKRNHTVTIRMNNEEYNLLQNKVKESGRTQQEVVIKAIADLKIASTEEVEELKRLNQMFADILSQLRGATTNINQIARKLHQNNQFTKAILFAKVPFELTTKEDRMRTCYMQACLAYVNFEGISNSDIRKIFGLGEKEKAKASRLLTSAVDGGYIKVMDPDTAPRYKKYIPYWA